jgi:Enterobacterial TraT complement resistance protein
MSLSLRLRHLVLVGGACLGLTLPLTSCAANRESAKTIIQWQGQVARLQPGSVGENRVWVDFNDISGGTTDLRPQIERAINAKGYVAAKSFDQADFVIWATVRFFDEVNEDNKSIRDAALTGAVVGGAAGAVVGYNSNATGGSQLGRTAVGGLGGAVVGAGIGAGIAMLTKESEYQLILDVQLARKISGGVETTVNASNQTSGKDASVGVSNNQLGASAQGAESDNKAGQSQQVTVKKLHLETENRLVASTKGTRLPKEEGIASIVAKLENAIPQLLPRAPAAQ